MHEIPQDLALELLILPAILLAIGTSVTQAIQLCRLRPICTEASRSAVDVAISWHLLLPLAAVIIAGRMLAIDHGDWLEFLDQPEAIVVLLVCLAVCGPNCGLRRSSDFQATSIWRIFALHIVGLVSALLCTWIFTEMFTGLVLLETSVALAEADSVFTGIPWAARQVAWPRILLFSVPGLALAIGLWSHVFGHDGRPRRWWSNARSAVLAVVGMLVMTWAIALDPMPIVCPAFVEAVPSVTRRLLLDAMPILSMFSFLVAWRMSTTAIDIQLPQGSLYVWQRWLHHLTLVAALVTLNWYSVLRNSAWPIPFHQGMLLSAFAGIRQPENITVNLVCIVLAVAIGTRWIQHRHVVASVDEHVVVAVNGRSLAVLTPVVYCLIALSTLSLFWTAIGLWAFLTDSS